MFRPDAAEIARLKAKVEQKVSGDQLRDNHFYAGLYSRTDGIFSDVRRPSEWFFEDGAWVRVRHRLRRREWIEKFFPIRTKAGEIALLKLNPAQRMIEAQIIRRERAGVPVRLLCLKARQMGCSTYVQGLMFERVLRGRHVRGLIVADNKERSETLLAIAQIARAQMVKDKNLNELWDFRMTSKARDTFRFDEPIVGEVEVTSSEAPAPGRGGTRTMLHLSESAFFKRADQTYSACVSSLPTLPGTIGFEESTANGDTGRFKKDFWGSYKESDLPLFERRNPWHAIFFAWWQHPDYAWTRSYGYGRVLPESKVAEIQATLDSEERWLLKQSYLRRWQPDDEWERVRAHYTYELIIEGTGPSARIVGEKRVHKDTWKWRRKGVGKQPVTFDQLAWRREKIQDKDFGGDVDKFNVEYPSRPQVAFLSSGRPVFNTDIVTRMQDHAKEHPPVFVGELRRKLEHTA